MVKFELELYLRNKPKRFVDRNTATFNLTEDQEVLFSGMTMLLSLEPLKATSRMLQLAPRVCSLVQLQLRT